MDVWDFFSERLYKEQVQDFLRYYDLKVSGNKDQLIDRLVSYQEFNIDEIPDLLYVNELQSICDDLDLPRTGRKNLLWERILDDIGGLTTSKKAVPQVKEEIIEEIVLKTGLSIEKINTPDYVSSNSHEFQIQIIIANNGLDTEIGRIWYFANWPQSRNRSEPKFDVDSQKEYVEDLILTTPDKEGKFSLIIKLLDKKDVLIKNQKIKLEIDVTAKGADKVMKWAKNVGKFILSKT